VDTAQDLAERDIGFKVLTGQGANIDTTTASGKLVFGLFAALAECDGENNPLTHPAGASWNFLPGAFKWP
jgi:hypothetical protein